MGHRRQDLRVLMSVSFYSDADVLKQGFAQWEKEFEHRSYSRKSLAESEFLPTAVAFQAKKVPEGST